MTRKKSPKKDSLIRAGNLKSSKIWGGPRLGPPALTSARRAACGTNAPGAENVPGYPVQHRQNSPRPLRGAENVPRYSVQHRQNSPRPLRGALRRAGGGCGTFRLQRPCISSKVQIFKTLEQLKGSGLDPPEKSQIFLDE